jgi:hypothetical protein
MLEYSHDHKTTRCAAADLQPLPSFLVAARDRTTQNVSVLPVTAVEQAPRLQSEAQGGAAWLISFNSGGVW